MSLTYTNAALAAIAEPRVNVKKLARGSASKAKRAMIAAQISEGLIVPCNFSAQQAAALLGVSAAYVSLHRKRLNSGAHSGRPALLALVVTSAADQHLEATH